MGPSLRRWSLFSNAQMPLQPDLAIELKQHSPPIAVVFARGVANHCGLIVAVAHTTQPMTNANMTPLGLRIAREALTGIHAQQFAQHTRARPIGHGAPKPQSRNSNPWGENERRANLSRSAASKCLEIQTDHAKSLKLLVPQEGIEPPTYALRMRRDFPVFHGLRQKRAVYIHAYRLISPPRSVYT